MRANMFRNSLIAYSETGEELEIPLEEWHDMEVRRPDSGQQGSRANRRDKSGAPDKASPDKVIADKVIADKAATADSPASAQAPSTSGATGCSGGCGTCGQCGPNGSRSARPTVVQPVPEGYEDAQVAPQVSGPQTSGPLGAGPQVSGPQVSGPQTSGPQESGRATDISADTNAKADTLPHRPLQATVHVAEQVMASLSGVHQPPSGVSEHGIPTTRARQAALAQSLAGMDGGPLCSITQADKPVSTAAIAATVIADVISVAEAAAKQAPASIVMSERLIKSTDTSALKTSRGRRKRRRKTRDGADGFTDGADGLADSLPDDAFDDNDIE